MCKCFYCLDDDSHLYVVAQTGKLGVADSGITGLLVKIGSSRNPDTRLTDLQVGNPLKLEMIARLTQCGRYEKTIHTILDGYNFKIRGEWFIIPVSEELRSWKGAYQYAAGYIEGITDTLIYTEYENCPFNL